MKALAFHMAGRMGSITWLLVAMTAWCAAYEAPCALTPDTITRIHKWVRSGVDPGLSAFDAMNCAVVSTAGGLVGGIGGGAAGYAMGDQLGSKFVSRFCGESEACKSRASLVSRISGGVLGYVAGGLVGHEAAQRTFGRGGFFRSGSVRDASRECATLFGGDRRRLPSPRSRARTSRRTSSP